MSSDQQKPNDNFPETELLLTEICWHYFANEMTQSEIAKLLGITRLRVNRAIQSAKKIGLVKIHLESPFLQRVQTQEKVQKTFNIKTAIVVPANPEKHDIHTPIGAALAEYLSTQIAQKKWKKIGVSWGMTLLAACNKLKRQSLPELEIISILGGTSSGANFSTFGIATGFAEALGANYSLLAAPIFLSEGMDREKFLSQKIYSEHFKKFECLDAAILTAGDMSSHSYLISNGLPEEVTVDDLTQLGAVGDVVGAFLDVEGNTISSPLTNRTIGIHIDQLQQVPERIMVAAGKHKVAVIKGALARGLITTLITDDITAEALLQLD